MFHAKVSDDNDNDDNDADDQHLVAMSIQLTIPGSSIICVLLYIYVKQRNSDKNIWVVSKTNKPR